MTIKEESAVSFSVPAPKQWHEYKQNFDYGCYLLCVEGYELDGEPHKQDDAKSVRITMSAENNQNYFEPLIKRYKTRVAAVNAVLQFLSKNKHLTNHKINL